MKKCGIMDYIESSVNIEFHLTYNARFIKVFT